MLVDVVTDKDFMSLQGYEALRFYNNALNTVIINESKLLRYASRRGCKAKIKEILDSVKQNEIID